MALAVMVLKREQGLVWFPEGDGGQPIDVDHPRNYETKQAFELPCLADHLDELANNISKGSNQRLALSTGIENAEYQRERKYQIPKTGQNTSGSDPPKLLRGITCR